MNSAQPKASRPVAQILGTLVIAVASAAAIVPLVALAMPGGPGGPGMMDGHGGHGMRHMLERMLDKVDATEAQRAQITQITQLAETDLRAQHEAGRALREQALALMAAPTLDAAAAESLRQQMLTRHDQASRRMMQAMLDIGNVLTPAQRVKLAEQMKRFGTQMHERGMLRQPMGGDAKS
jgi:periplasmic protein CpxP/Spy